MHANLLTAYADLIDGVRSHFAKKEGDDWAASFSSAMLFSALCAVNLLGALVLVDLALNGNLESVDWLNSNRLALIGIMIAIGALHLYFARVAGVYDRRGGPRFPGWQRRVKIYAAVTACNFVLPIAIIIAVR